MLVETNDYYSQRQLTYSVGLAGIDSDLTESFAYEHRFSALIEYPDIIFDLEITSTRFRGFAGSPFYYSGGMGFGRHLLPGFILTVGPTFFNRVDIPEGLFGVSGKVNLQLMRKKNIRIVVIAGTHLTSQFVTWSGNLGVAYMLDN